MTDNQKSKIAAAKSKFLSLFHQKPEIIINSPGRIEVIGNHTDYNNGYALSACISKSIICLLAKRTDNKVRIYSDNYPDSNIIEFALEDIKKDTVNSWTNYARGIIRFLNEKKQLPYGADIFVDSNIPVGSGVSSSAAYEMAVAKGLVFLFKTEMDDMELAKLAKKAENEFVESPCGFLDQGTIAFGQKEKFVFLDFLPKEDDPVSKIELISADISKANLSFIVTIDKTAKRQLGESGYPARRKKCEESLPFWSDKLKREIKSLRDVTTGEFEQYKNELYKLDEVMGKRVEHIIYENERVLDSIEALKSGDFVRFGNLLTASGKSALELYELDEDTPELTFLYDEGKILPGVLGIRNMGGGFSATVLLLIKDDKLDEFKNKLSANYKNKFKKELDFVEFEITDGVREVNGGV